ncbi:four helix bundle protein [Tenacibaculum sp. 1_MG-2023]|uniref:four helix bundle protein n=1 Tax=Tenacibaculum sp. 1_MG-2023 TaxID=3062653 RepID=UPI0026E4843A|nr:four helix bundle protein [Tenacibaculum sp. 1_MG-2023]MDO6676418.1 four helix bundle protein [Tenacibaculum sp. 1_MG-2023]
MKEQIKNRTKQFAIDCWRLCEEYPKTREFDAYCRQLIRCSSSVGANYRAACRAKSSADFIHKLKIVEEEVDESMFFLEIFMSIHENNQEELKRLHKEANELTSIIVTSIKKVKSKSSINKSKVVN